ncbi:TIGR02450 family Trp-rich protein [Ningiella sp. W23]|uniref:TIGR02450 family Trp-rich protein n=1 Tax=Ningiella sp. W23 TaxID=3023715 RepID=UPI0037565B16
MELRKKEKHFIIVKVEFDDDGKVVECLLEALLSRRHFAINWRDLKNSSQWVQGWV